MQPFHRIFIDWLNLKEDCDGYQRDKAIIKQVIIIICKATGIAITYTTQSAKKNENLSLI